MPHTLAASDYWQADCLCIDGQVHQPATHPLQPCPLHINGPVPCPTCRPAEYAAWIENLNATQTPTD